MTYYVNAGSLNVESGGIEFLPCFNTLKIETEWERETAEKENWE